MGGAQSDVDDVIVVKAALATKPADGDCGAATSKIVGNSVVCMEPIDHGEVIIHLPADLLINVKTVSCEINADFEWSTHEILALELLRLKKEANDPWVETLPQSFESMPLSWSVEDQLLVPHKNKIELQRRELENFANKVDASLEECSWAWKCVNTRCLYWHDGGMTMAPIIDYLNHTCDQSLALKVEVNTQGITVFTNRTYEAGEELTFCYGPHDNGFLLVEYGFIADEINPWDFIDITEEICKLLDFDKRQWLQDNGYWGDYTIDRDGQPSFRTEVALAAAQPAANTKILTNLISGYDDGARFQKKSHEILKEISGLVAKKLHRCASSSRPEIQRLFRHHSKILSKVE